MSGAMKFSGDLKVRIGEAVGLQPTRWSLRHSLFRKGYQLLDPYVTVSVDQVSVRALGLSAGQRCSCSDLC